MVCHFSRLYHSKISCGIVCIGMRIVNKTKCILLICTGLFAVPLAVFYQKSTAQELIIPKEYFIQEENFVTEPPLRVYDSEQITAFDKGSYPIYVVRDIYGRIRKTVQDFPFGYYAVIEYIWWPDNYQNEKSWFEPRKKEETGYLYKNNKKSGRYKITYDKKETIVTKESDDTSVIRKIISVLAPIFRLFNPGTSENEEIQKLLK